MLHRSVSAGAADERPYVLGIMVSVIIGLYIQCLVLTWNNKLVETGGVERLDIYVVTLFFVVERL